MVEESLLAFAAMSWTAFVVGCRLVLLLAMYFVVGKVLQASFRRNHDAIIKFAFAVRNSSSVVGRRRRCSLHLGGESMAMVRTAAV